MLFEQATRMKLRISSSYGNISVEELWDLPLTSRSNKLNLDDIARSLHLELKNQDDVSFVTEKTSPKQSLLQLQFDIVKHIIDVKLAERNAAVNATKEKEKKDKILKIISEKEEDNLKNLSVDELKAMIYS